MKSRYRSGRATPLWQVVAVATALCVIAPFVLLAAGVAWQTVAAIVVVVAVLGTAATSFMRMGELRARITDVESAFDDAVRRCDAIAHVNQELAAANSVEEADRIVVAAAEQILEPAGCRSCQIIGAGAPAPSGEDAYVLVEPVEGENTTFMLVALTEDAPTDAVRDALRALAASLEVTRERLMLTAALRNREEHFRALVQNAPDAITVHSNEGTIVYASPATARFGAEPRELLGTPWDAHVHEGDLESVRSSVEGLMAEAGSVTSVEYRWMRPDGTTRWVESTLTNQLDDAVVQGVIANHRDVTERRTLEERLAHQAFNDTLTGLPNRASVLDRIGRVAAHSARTGERFAVLFLDIDRFKGMNDTYGHDAGDQVLVEVAQRLRASIRPADTAARLGGDEFAILLDVVDGENGALTVARRIHDAFESPLMLGDETVAIRVSIGVAVADPDDGVTADGLLRNADAAMYVAKAKGRSRVEVFDPEIHREVIDRLRLETELRAALLDRRQLHIQYQPVVDLRSGVITGFEALVRWRHPVRGLIGPDTFIPVAEEMGLITQIGAHVLRRACGTAAELQRQFGRPLTVGVNVSPRQFLDPALPDDVIRSLALAELDPEQLLIEITETSLLRDVDAAVGVLEELRGLGVRVAIDDFGTGYSSLGYLRRLPVDVLKVDRSFVRDVDGSVEQSAVAQAVIKLARTFRLEAIAEGIEHPRQLAALVRLGCQLGQGYLFAEPLERDELESFIAKGAFPKTAGPDGQVTGERSLPTVREDEAPARAASGES